MPTQTFWTHGCTVERETAGPVQITVHNYGAQINSMGLSDPFVMIALPCPMNINGAGGSALNVFLKYKLGGPTSKIDTIALMDGDTLVQAWPAALLPPPPPPATPTVLTLAVTPTTPIVGGLALSIRVHVVPPDTFDIIGAGIEVKY